MQMKTLRCVRIGGFLVEAVFLTYVFSPREGRHHLKRRSSFPLHPYLLGSRTKKYFYPEPRRWEGEQRSTSETDGIPLLRNDGLCHRVRLAQMAGCVRTRSRHLHYLTICNSLILSRR